MLNGPALLRVFLVVIAAAVLTGLVQHYWVFDSTPAEASKPVARPSTQNGLVRRTDPAPARVAAAPNPAPEPTAPAKPVEAAKPPAPDSISTTPPQAETLAPPPNPAPANADTAASQPASPQVSPSPAPLPSGLPTAPPVATPSPPMEAAQGQPVEQDAAAEPADGRAIDLVDLNTGTLAELNTLKGGGTIGRAIIQHRPYSSTDQLLSKRVLSRTTYQRIKGQITVR